MKKRNVRDYLWKEKRLLSIVVISGTICSLFMSMINVLQGKLLDVLLTSPTLQAILMQIAVFLLVVIGIQGLRYIKRYYTRRFANRVSVDMRTLCYHNMLKEPVEVMEHEQDGDMITRILQDVDLCAEGMRKVLTEVFDTGLLLLSYLAAMLAYDVPLGFLSILFVPIACIIAAILKQRVFAYTKQARLAASTAADLTINQVSHALYFRIAGCEARNLEAYRQSQEDLFAKNCKTALIEVVMSPIYQIISMLGVLLIFVMGGGYVMEGSWTIGSFTAFLSIFIIFAQKASKAAQLVNIVQKAIISWRRIEPYLLVSDTQFTSPTPLQGTHLSVEHLTFAYPNCAPLFQDVSFALQKGELVGVCGGIACGKSTLLQLLCQLYAYDGVMKLDEHIIQAEDYLCSYMGHAPSLFSESMRDNITWQTPGDLDEIIQLSQLASVLQVRSLEDEVGNEGSRFSDGQRKRIALARALFAPTDFVLLDDPFSALDPRTQDQLFEALQTWRNKGILLTTHRVELFPRMDRILFIRGDHSIVEGTHATLYEQESEYRRMVDANA